MWKANLKPGCTTPSSLQGRRTPPTSTNKPVIVESSQTDVGRIRSELKISGDINRDLSRNDLKEECVRENGVRNNEEEREERRSKINRELSKLPKIGDPAAQSEGRKHGLSKVQVDRKIQDLRRCIQKGELPSKCKCCQQTKAYMYHSFYKRGGTKELFCCANCFSHWFEFSCEEEDYDFLSG
jgi:hypothetical protein